MTLKLVQVRRCDGACCIESPRFPNRDHTDCIYHNRGIGKESAGCMLMTGEATIRGDEEMVKYESRSRESIHDETCVKWPQENSNAQRGDTGGCCWQYVNGD